MEGNFACSEILRRKNYLEHLLQSPEAKFFRGIFVRGREYVNYKSFNFRTSFYGSLSLMQNGDQFKGYKSRIFKIKTVSDQVKNFFRNTSKLMAISKLGSFLKSPLFPYFHPWSKSPKTSFPITC